MDRTYDRFFGLPAILTSRSAGIKGLDVLWARRVACGTWFRWNPWQALNRPRGDNGRQPGVTSRVQWLAWRVFGRRIRIRYETISGANRTGLLSLHGTFIRLQAPRLPQKPTSPLTPPPHTPTIHKAGRRSLRYPRRSVSPQPSALKRPVNAFRDCDLPDVLFR
jgi:hypothetical protein